jgi:hypothetical protein
MKVDELVFKLIDHDTKTIKKICIKIICAHKPEWDQTDPIHQESKTMDEQHRMWMVKYAEMKHGMKAMIASMIREHHPEIKDFVLKKIKKSSECTMININRAMGTESNKMHMMKVHGMKRCMMKYCKGKKPAMWIDIFNYKVIFSEHIFEAKSVQEVSGANPKLVFGFNEQKFTLVPLASYGNEKSNMVMQKGGDDDYERKSAKYKHKYLELKKQQW